MIENLLKLTYKIIHYLFPASFLAENGIRYCGVSGQEINYTIFIRFRNVNICLSVKTSR